MVKPGFYSRFHTACVLLLSVLTTTPSIAASNQDVTIAHGFAMHGDPAYGKDFQHFSYANPDAPKGGRLRLGVVGNSFDSFNPFVIKGVSASGIGQIYDTLAVQAEDEPFSGYGLVAEKIEMPKDRSWVTFHLNPKARFHDGHPITAEDVIFTFDSLTKNEKAQPFYRAYYADVKEVIAESDHKVRFNFKDDKNKELPLILGQLPILPKHFYQKHKFETANLDIPLGSGPYRVKSFESGRSITYERVKDYWAKDLPVKKGFYNFDEIIHEYYKDSTVALEAFKAGEFDFRLENSSKNWATQYKGPQFDKGKIVKKEFSTGVPAGMQGFVFNLRRPMFADVKVREALGLAFDFEWTNKNMLYGQYKRTNSYWANSELASRDLPQGEELKILNEYKDKLPSELFSKPFKLPENPTPRSIRQNLRKATQLLKSANWVVKDGKLVNSKGKPFEFEFLLSSPSMERVVLPFIDNLKRLGITANARLVDTTQYIKRVRDFDFDMLVLVIAQSNSPGNEQLEFWHSSRAELNSSRNYMGIKNPVIDELIEKVIDAPDRGSLVQRTRALDRALLWNYYVIPQFHIPYERIAYWSKLAHPEKHSLRGAEIMTWWAKP